MVKKSAYSLYSAPKLNKQSNKTTTVHICPFWMHVYLHKYRQVWYQPVPSLRDSHRRRGGHLLDKRVAATWSHRNSRGSSMKKTDKSRSQKFSPVLIWRFKPVPATTWTVLRMNNRRARTNFPSLVSLQRAPGCLAVVQENMLHSLCIALYPLCKPLAGMPWVRLTTSWIDSLDLRCDVPPPWNGRQQIFHHPISFVEGPQASPSLPSRIISLSGDSATPVTLRYHHVEWARFEVQVEQDQILQETLFYTNMLKLINHVSQVLFLLGSGDPVHISMIRWTKRRNNTLCTIS